MPNSRRKLNDTNLTASELAVFRALNAKFGGSTVRIFATENDGTMYESVFEQPLVRDDTLEYRRNPGWRDRPVGTSDHFNCWIFLLRKRSGIIPKYETYDPNSDY
jgi:hypothetical protein